jgi:hypothetical protein
MPIEEDEQEQERERVQPQAQRVRRSTVSGVDWTWWIVRHQRTDM